MAEPNNTHSQIIQSNRAASVVRCMITALILFFIVLSTVSLLAWYIIHPRIPKFHVKSLSVSNFTLLDDTKLLAKYQITLVVYNPNRNINLWFSNLDVSIAYKNCELSTINYVHSFPLHKMGRAEKVVELETNASNARAIGSKHVEEIYLSGNEMIFDVKMRVGAKFRAGKWISKEKLVNVGCDNLQVGFKDKSFINGTSGKLTNGDGADCYSFFSES